MEMKMGAHASQSYHYDPRRFAISLSRYKFAAKMISGAQSTLEVGCGDGFASRLLKQETERLTCIDKSEEYIKSANVIGDPAWPIEFFVHNILSRPVPGRFDALVSLDVLEHIPLDLEAVFIRNSIYNLSIDGVAVIGMPSINSQQYASKLSKEQHVNCKQQPEFKGLMQRYFVNVFMFSMNDEVVHTGYGAMAHYHIALCAGVRL